MSARPLVSAGLASSVLASDFVLLTLFLNPHVSLRTDGAALVLCLLLPYAVGAGLLFLALRALLGAALASRRMARRPSIIEGLPSFATLSMVAVTGAALLFWVNLLAYRHSIPVESVRAVAASSIALTVAALVLLAITGDAFLFPNHGRALAAPLAVLAAGAAVVVPLALRPLPHVKPQAAPLATETIRPLRRVILVGVDGIGPGPVLEGARRGDLPGFDRILRRGAFGALGTLLPTEAPPVWTTLMTGRLPRDHGVKSFATYRLRGSTTPYEVLPKGALVSLLERLHLVSTSAVTSESRRCRTIWNALNAFDIETGLVRLRATYPVERVQGFMLSHAFDLLQGDPGLAAQTLYPPDLLPEVRARVVNPGDIDRQLLAEFVDQGLAGSDDLWRRELVEKALVPDLTYERAGSVLRAAYDPPFFAIHSSGLEVVGHAFMRYARPDAFGDVQADEVRRYGRVYDRYVRRLSDRVGELANHLRPDEVLVVVSGYGMEPVSPWRRLLNVPLGVSASGTHEYAPDGFIMAVGEGIRPGVAIRSASVLDVTPTLLYLMGLPVARDMEGRVLAEIMDDELLRGNPLTVIPSYENLAVTAPAPRAPADLPTLPEEAP